MGEYLEGSYNGVGTHTYPDGMNWEGEWKDDKRVNGKGFIKYINGSIYEGLLLNSEYEGKGIFTYSDGNKWIGEWKEGKMVAGHGTVKNSDGSTYVGEYSYREYNLSLIHI